MSKALKVACKVVERDARDRCPKGETNRLRDTISVLKITKDSGTIGTPLYYAPYVEFGTGNFVDPNCKYAGTGRQGYWVYVKYSPHKESTNLRKVYSYQQALWIYKKLKEKGLDPVITNGQHPQPFLQPAILENKTKIIDAFKKSIEEQMK